MAKTAKEQPIKNFILQNLRSHPSDIVSFTAGAFNISRQSVWKHLRDLIAHEQIKASGSTKNTLYRLIPSVDFQSTYAITPEAAEDKVWRSYISICLNDLPKNIYDIYQYGFTEIFNNALDHSEGTTITVKLERYPDIIRLAIEDNGIGIFNKIQHMNSLDDPIHAVLELSKGKLTTDPKHHTGEGIFFTSRMFDHFYIFSDRLTFSHNDQNDTDIILDDKLYPLGIAVTSGTCVVMEISATSQRTSHQIFDQYTTFEDGIPSFDRTIVPVFLAIYGNDNLISRSQAKRLLARFERFREVILDFDKVDMIGQAFADEIFRVYQNDHPNVHLKYIRANPEISAMLSRAIPPASAA